MVLCQYCNKEYKTYQSRSNHIKKFHNNNKQSIPSNSIKSEVVLAKNTPNGVNITDIKPNSKHHICDYCNNEFTRSDSLKKHYNRCKSKNNTINILKDQLTQMQEETIQLKSLLVELMNKKAKVHHKTLHSVS